MCNYSKREQAMVIVRPGVWCDPCLVPLVRALYENGFPTIASCCGHGKRPSTVLLADGREVSVSQFAGHTDPMEPEDGNIDRYLTPPEERTLGPHPTDLPCLLNATRNADADSLHPETCTDPWLPDPTPPTCPDHCRDGMNRSLPLVPCANPIHSAHTDPTGTEP